MTRTVYKFTFTKEVEISDINNAMAMAAIAVEAIYGEPAMKIDGKFYVSDRQRICLIDSESQLGQDLAKVFAGFIDLNDKGSYMSESIEFGRPLGTMVDHFRKYEC
ncbi:MAG: hypothetical protein ACYC27_19555 [Armatimonadota bacterium]